MLLQLAAEERAAAAAKGGLGKKLKEAEGRADALSETVAELRAGLERQRAAADLRWDCEMLDMHFLNTAYWQYAAAGCFGRVRHAGSGMQATAAFGRHHRQLERRQTCWTPPGEDAALQGALIGVSGQIGEQCSAEVKPPACREDMLQREMREVERRCQGAEARHEELASNIPEATRPLLRQLEAMQVSTAALVS